MNIRIRGISYHIDRHQEDQQLPDLVLLHGFLGSGEIFEPLLQYLKSFSNPITIDLLGHGKTEGAELHYRFSTQEQVADLSKLISEQITNPVFLYGYSMGARLALQIALIKTDLIQGLILESGTFGIEDETERQVRQALDASRADQIMGNYNGFLNDWGKTPLFKDDLSENKGSKISDIQKKQNNIWMANSLLGFGTGTMPCIREKLGTLRCPVHLIVGEKDSKFVRINQTMNREILQSDLSIVKTANHRVHSDQPEKCAEIINTFITKHHIS